MKTGFLTLIAFCLLSAQVVGQLSLQNAVVQVPNSTTTMKAVEIADLNNDGLNDIVAGPISYGTSTMNVVLYLQNTNGTLAAPTNLAYSQSGEMLYDIELADLNNDKRNDIVLTFGSAIGIFYQQATGGFGSMKKLTAVQSSCGVKTADLNNDGLMDLLGFQSSSFKLFLQNSSGEFNLTSIQVKSASSKIIQVGDLNGDGLTDIANCYGRSIEIVYQHPNTGFTPVDTVYLTVPTTETSYLDGFNIADINSDSRMDIAMVYGGNMGHMKLIYQTADGKLSISNAKTYKTYDIPTPICVADLNCDGDRDIILGHTGWANISVFDKLNQTDFSDYTLFPSLYYFSNFGLAVGDINDDHLPDIVHVDQNAKMSLFYNTTKPSTFDSYEHIAPNVQVYRDTTVVDTVKYFPRPDAVTDCRPNNFTKMQLHQRWENKHYSGDSLLVRHGRLCSAYTDTIRTPFKFTKSNLLKGDTVTSVVNLDTMKTWVNATNFEYGMSDGEIDIATNMCWNIEIDRDWVEPMIYSGKSSGTGAIEFFYIPFVVKSNNSIETREARMTISGENGIPSYTYTIRQVGVKPEIYMTATSLILNETVYNAAHLALLSYVNWTAHCDADWLTLDKTQGPPTTGDYDILTMEALPNYSDYERNATLTLTGDSGVVKTVTVRQLKFGYVGLAPTSENGVQLYPNPIGNELHIELSAGQKCDYLELCDLRGRKLFETGSLAEKSILDFSRYQKGMYLLRMKIGNEVVVRKVLKK